MFPPEQDLVEFIGDPMDAFWDAVDQSNIPATARLEAMTGHLDPEDGCILFDGFEDAFISIGYRGSQCVAIYDESRCVSILMDRDGMDVYEAQEFIDFNVAGSYLGDHTPILLHRHQT